MTMILFAKPSAESVRGFLARQRGQPFSYPEVGASRGGSPPPGYCVDHRRTRLGTGRDDFERAREALCRWEMFRLGWVEARPDRAAIEPGTTVAVAAGRCGLWTLNACRIVYTIDEDEPESKDGVKRFGFAYGTLPDHVERGEERFSVEWRREDDSVWYDLWSFSWPNHFIAQCGYPFVRRVQKRFAIDSARAMERAVWAAPCTSA